MGRDVVVVVSSCGHACNHSQTHLHDIHSIDGLVLLTHIYHDITFRLDGLCVRLYIQILVITIKSGVRVYLVTFIYIYIYIYIYILLYFYILG